MVNSLQLSGVLLLLATGLSIARGNVFLRRQISEEGDNLEIGRLILMKVGKTGSKYKCIQNTNENDYRDYYMTKVSNLTDRDPRMAQRIAKSIYDYFMVIEKEIWSCTDINQEYPPFMRVVNELIGIKEIASIRYMFNAEVTTKHYLGKKKTAWVRETALFTHSEEAQGQYDIPCQFHGEITLEKTEKENDNELLKTDKPSHHPKVIDNVELDGKKDIKELNYYNGVVSFSMSPESSLPRIILGSRKRDIELGNVDSVAVCYQLQGINPFPFNYRTEIREYHRVSSAKILTYRLMDKYYFENFIPIKEEVWSCRIYQGKGQGEPFLRVVNEMVGRKPLQTVEFHHTIVYAANVSLHETDKKSIRFKEIKYLHPENGQTIFYSGSMRLYAEKKNTNMTLRDVIFNLEFDSLYRTIVNVKGFDFQVGTKWEKIIGKGEDKVGCVRLESIVYNKALSTEIRYKTRIGDIAFSTKEVGRRDSFIHEKQTVFNCTNTEETITFLRVKNDIELRVPVHEIESTDSVRISYKYFPLDDERPVRIIEIKYLDPNEYTVLRYDGELEIESMSPNMEPLDYEIKKTRDDFVPSFGHQQAKYHTLRDIVITKHKGWVFYLFGSASKETLILDMEREEDDTIGNEEDFATCTEKDVTRVFKLFKKTGENDEVEVIGRDQSKYVNVVGEEVWYCSIREKMDGFHRQLYNVKLPKALPEKLYSLQYTDNIDMHFVIRSAGDYRMEFDKTIYRDKRKSLTNKEDTRMIYRNYKYSGFILESGKEKKIEGMTWMSGTMPLPQHDLKFEVDYEIPDHTLDNEYLYKTTINSEGLSVEIGSPWTREEGTEESQVTCRPEANLKREEYFNTFYKTKVKILGRNNHKNDFDDVFESLYRGVWICQNRDIKSPNIKFRRIANHFSIKHASCSTIKEFLHYDGFTFLVGKFTHEHVGCMEIVEIKYLDFNNQEVLKYEGKIELHSKDGNPVVNRIRAHRLQHVAKKDADYISTTSETYIFRKVIASNGHVLKFTSGIQIKHKLQNLQASFKCQPIKDDDQKIPENLRKIFKTIDHIKIPHKLSENKLESITYNAEVCFSSTTEVWECQAEGEGVVYRVVNLIQHKAHLSYKTKCWISRIYYPVGVIYYPRDDLLMKQTRYFDRDTGSQLQFDAYLPFDIDEKIDNYWNIRLPEVRYRPEMLHLKNVKKLPTSTGKEYSIEVGSPWQMTLKDDGNVARCVMEPVEFYSSSWDIVQYSNLERRKNGDAKQLIEEKKILEDQFQRVKQVFYKCENSKGQDFYRVENIWMDLRHTVHQILHHDSVTVDYKRLPNNNEVVQLKEVKYLDSTKRYVMRYKGKITLVKHFSEKYVNEFQIPSHLEKSPTEENRESGEETPSTVRMFWPLELLSNYVLKLDIRLFVESAEINYRNGIWDDKDYEKEKELQVIQATLIKKGKNGRILVGERWVKKIKEGKEKMRCIPIEYSENYMKFTTKVVLYIDDIHYVLDEKTILNFFKIIRINVWFCANEKDRALRVVTEMKSIIPIKAVEYYDGVDVQSTPMEDAIEETTAHITETKFVSPEDFSVIKVGEKVLLYTGQIRSMEVREYSHVEKVPTWTDRIYRVWNKILGFTKRLFGIQDTRPA